VPVFGAAGMARRCVQGVAGLSVGEIARRMGIRPPSVYVYFPSKHALYDALFARGAQLLLEAADDQLIP